MGGEGDGCDGVMHGGGKEHGRHGDYHTVETAW